MNLNYFLSTEFWNLTSILGASIYATVTYGKLLLDYFDPIRRKLNFFNKYKSQYGSSFNDDTNNFLNTQINNLSLLKISKLHDLNKALIFIDISNKNKLIKVNYYLLRTIINKSIIESDRTIYLFESDIKAFNRWHSKKINIIWYTLSIIGFLSLLLSIHILYEIYIDQRKCNLINVLSIISMLYYTYIGIYTFFFRKPLNKETIDVHLKMIDDWNDEIKTHQVT